MFVRVKYKELRKIGVMLPKKPFTKYYLTRPLLTDDIDVFEVRLTASIGHKYRNNDDKYEELKNLYLSKLKEKI